MTSAMLRAILGQESKTMQSQFYALRARVRVLQSGIKARGYNGAHSQYRAIAQTAVSLLGVGLAYTLANACECDALTNAITAHRQGRA